MKKIIQIVSCITILIFLRTGFALAADQVYFYYTDPAGTPMAMSDASGNVVWKADYLPFGEELLDTATIENNKMFVGKEKDKETGFYYFGARYLESTTGRFLSIDPKGPISASTGKINEKFLLNPQRLNRYAYAGNNPYAFVDPDGLDWYIAQKTGHLIYSNPTGQTYQYIDFGNVSKSGKGEGLNNPDKQGVANIGPTVTGTYTIGFGEDYTIQTGKLKGTVLRMAMQLFPDDATAALIKSLNRDPDSFLNHKSLRKDGGTAGCIAMSDEMRSLMNEFIWETYDMTLHVVPTDNDLPKK